MAGNFADNFGGRIERRSREWKFADGRGLDLGVANNGPGRDVQGRPKDGAIHRDSDFRPYCRAVMLVVNQFSSPNHRRIGSTEGRLVERRTLEFQPAWRQRLAT